MPPFVIAFISQKGGTGKTTTALTLAVAATQSGKSVLVLDLDPQANMTSWHQSRADKSPLVHPRPRLRPIDRAFWVIVLRIWYGGRTRWPSCSRRR